MKLKKQMNLLVIDSVINGFSKYPLWILLSLYLNTRGYNFIDIGIIIVLSNIISSPLQRKSGKLIDILGRFRFSYIIPFFMFIVYSILYLSVSFNLSIYLIFIMLTLSSYLSGFEGTLKNTIISDLSLEGERTKYFSVMRIWANVGIGIGLICSGLASTFSYSLFFIAPIIGSLAQMTLFYVFFEETGKTKQAGIDDKVSIIRGSGYGRIISVSLLIGVCFAIANQYETPAMPLYLKTQWLLSPFLITILYSINTAVVVFFQSSITKFAVKYTDHRIFSAGILFYSLAFLIFSLTANIFLLASAIIILTVGENLMSPVSSSIISKIAPEDKRGEYFGINSFIYNIVSPVSLFLGIGLLQIFSTHETYAMYALSALSIIAFLVAYTYLGNLSGKGVPS